MSNIFRKMTFNTNQTFKIVLIGDGAVGKTSLRRTFMGKSFRENYILTIGADFSIKDLDFEGYPVKLQIWDLAGQPRFSDVRGAYYMGCYGAVVVFDITRPNTFSNIDYWINELIKFNDNKLVPMIIIGNKSDLRETSPPEIQVTKMAAEAYAMTLSQWGGFKISYMETSAKTGENVENSFTNLINSIYSLMGV